MSDIVIKTDIDSGFRNDTELRGNGLYGDDLNLAMEKILWEKGWIDTGDGLAVTYDLCLVFSGAV